MSEEEAAIRGIAERLLGAAVVVILMALPVVIHQPALLAIVAVAVFIVLARPTILAGGGGEAAIIRAETAARHQQAQDDRNRFLLRAQLIGGAVVFAFGVLDLYLLNRLPLAVDLALIAAGALAWGVKIRWPFGSSPTG